MTITALYASPADTLDHNRTMKAAVNEAIIAGQVKVINGQVVVAVNTTAADVENIWVYRGLTTFKKKDTDVFLAGAVVYYDATLGQLTITAADNTKAGMCPAFYASAAVDATINLNENL